MTQNLSLRYLYCPSEIVQRIMYVELRLSTVMRLTYYVASMLLFASPCELTTKLSQG